MHILMSTEDVALEIFFSFSRCINYIILHVLLLNLICSIKSMNALTGLDSNADVIFYKCKFENYATSVCKHSQLKICFQLVFSEYIN